MSAAIIELEKLMNKDAFTKLTEADQLLVAEKVLEERNKQGGLQATEESKIPNTAGKFFNEQNKLEAGYVLGIVEKVIAEVETKGTK